MTRKFEKGQYFIKFVEILNWMQAASTSLAYIFCPMEQVKEIELSQYYKIEVLAV